MFSSFQVCGTLFNITGRRVMSDAITVLPFYSHSKLKEGDHQWLNEHGVDCRIFSNLYPCIVEIDSISYSSTETYFQQYKYPSGDKNFLCALTNMGDVASFGQRRLRFAAKHLNIIKQLKDEGKEYPVKLDGSDYEKKEKACPKLRLEVFEWDEKKVSLII